MSSPRPRAPQLRLVRGRTLLMTLLMMPLVACSSSRLVGPREFQRFVAAESTWRSRPFQDYSYEIRSLCFCSPEVTRWTRVSVREGAVVAAEAVEPDPDFPITLLELWHPIDSLFAQLRRTFEDPSARSHLEAIVVSYDPELGFPTHLEYRAKPTIADGGSTHMLRNVRPLE
ncbi:MAG TPA: DUF6174 domain-containing protein [Gemmatimonadaceae bacterium]|nr:DUF6174 domain-containing protein [Gemmatimonadaceae bacterium]